MSRAANSWVSCCAACTRWFRSTCCLCLTTKSLRFCCVVFPKLTWMTGRLTPSIEATTRMTIKSSGGSGRSCENGHRCATCRRHWSVSASVALLTLHCPRRTLQEERAKLLQFATGTSSVPAQGFGAMQVRACIQQQLHYHVQHSRLLHAY